MGPNTFVSLGDYFDNFVENRLAESRFKNSSEVIRDRLSLLEEENRFSALKSAIQDGINSRIVQNFNTKKHLESLKAGKSKMAKYVLSNEAVEDHSKI